MANKQNLGELAQQRRGQSQNGNGTSQQQGPKINPEIDQKIDAFIAENQDMFAYYNGLPKERLVRGLMMNKMFEADRRQKIGERQVEALEKWVADRPDVQQRINAKLKNVPTEKQTGAFVNLARREQQRVGATAPAPAAAPRMGVG